MQSNKQQFKHAQKQTSKQTSTCKRTNTNQYSQTHENVIKQTQPTKQKQPTEQTLTFRALIFQLWISLNICALSLQFIPSGWDVTISLNPIKTRLYLFCMYVIGWIFLTEINSFNQRLNNAWMAVSHWFSEFQLQIYGGINPQFRFLHP